jgi:hypothetical protein
LAELLGVIGSIGKEPSWCWNAAKKGGGADQLVRLTWRDRKGERAPGLVGYGVNLGRPSAARSADGVLEVPPFAPAAER